MSKRYAGPLGTGLLLLLLIACTLPAFAQAPVPPPVQQNLGIPDRVFDDLQEADCRFCHDQNPPPGIPVDPTYLPDRHHLLLGTPIPPNSSVRNPDADGDGVDDITYGCLNCHNLEFDPDQGTYVIVEDFRDCLNCHLTSPHHTTTQATTGNCQACHGSLVDRGLFDDNGDGIAETVDAPWVPTYPASLVTPAPSDKDVIGRCSTTTAQTCSNDGGCPAGEACVPDGILDGGQPPNAKGVLAGNCNYCHDSGVLPDGTGVVTNRLNHHGTNLHNLGSCSATTTRTCTSNAGCPSGETCVSANVCFWCHKDGNPNSTDSDRIRACENCHGTPSLHNIQVDSDATGQVDTDGDGIPDTDNLGNILPGAENPYWGHIGNSDDCWGCHGYDATTLSAPGSGPVVPNLDTLSTSSVLAGADTAITLIGKAFVSKIQNPMTGAFDITLTSDVVLTDVAGVETVLTPISVTEDTIEVVIPATMAAGNYEIAARKAAKRSNPMGLSVTPPVVIDTIICDAGSVTITGSGFSQYLDAADSSTSVIGEVATLTETAAILSWTDTEIVADFSACPTCVTVTTVFSSAITCDSPCKDTDGDGYSPDAGSCGPVDCDDTNPTVHPGVREDTCDGIDDDCNGVPDDGFVPQTITCGVGVCASAGVTSCENGVALDVCNPGVPTENPEFTCEDGLDNDCDGQTDAADADCRSPEICDDGVDNDRDGKVDCADKKDCGKDPACEKPCKGKNCA